jgi:TonB-linked SusC/RagA family outer membrane protein
MLGIGNAFSSTYSQTTLLSLDINNQSIREVMGIIENKTEYVFFFSDNIGRELDRKVNIHVKSETLNTILENLFRDTDLTYRIKDRQVSIGKDLMKELLPALPRPEQAKTVTGLVTDQTQEPLIGVNILVKGTTTGTVTDVDGRFSLSYTQSDPVFVVSYIGYKSQEIRVANQTNLRIVLLTDELGLEEVVVVGYGEVKKRDLTGSVTSVAVADIDKQPVIRIEDALKGKAAGVQISKQNSAPGAGMKIRIRGTNSVNGNNDPLYIIDGFIGGDFASLNPNDIESINILKDASATAIYGSRGSNGVVLVTTKQAKEGESRIEYNGFLSFDKISKNLDLLSASEYMQVTNAREAELGSDKVWFSPAEIAEMERTGGVDYVDEVLRTGITQNHQLSIAGGTPKIKYYLSGSYLDQEGIVVNSNYKRYGLRSNINSTVGNSVDVGFNLYGTFIQSRNNYVYNGRNTVMGHALIFPRNIPIMDPATGDYTRSPAGYGPISSNPVFSAREGRDDHNGMNLLSNLYLAWRIYDGLKLSVSGGINIGGYDNPNFKRNGPGASPASSEGMHSAGLNYVYQNTNILSYEKVLNEIHRLDVSAVYEQQKSVSRGTWAYASGFPTNSLTYNAIQMGTNAQVSSGYDEWELQSFLGRINYTLQEKYLFTATFRADGSSKFAEGNKYAYFPSAAVAWRASEEAFIKDLDIFQNLKIRGSYGIVGSQAIGTYKTLSTMRMEREYFFDKAKSTGIGAGAPANPDLKWESTAQTNFGLDFGLFGGQLSGTVDYYYKKTTDLLFDVTIPSYLNGGGITRNIGSMENKGWEFMLTGVIADRKDFQLITSANLSLNRNKILDMGEEKEIFVNWANAGASYSGYSVLHVGEPLSQFRGYIWDGIWQENEAAEAALFNSRPGDSKYRNIKTETDPSVAEQITVDDMTIIGNGLPDFIWGWNTTAFYKDFDLNIYINGMQGNDVWNFTRHLITAHHVDVPVSTSREILNRWTPSNPGAKIAAFSATDNNRRQSSQYVEDGSFMRLSNITLGYTFNRLLKNTFVRDAKIYISAQNLFILTKYSGYDPESSVTPTSGDSNADKVQGFDDACYPPTRSFILGVKFSF